MCGTSNEQCVHRCVTRSGNNQQCAGRNNPRWAGEINPQEQEGRINTREQEGRIKHTGAGEETVTHGGQEGEETVTHGGQEEKGDCYLSTWEAGTHPEVHGRRVHTLRFTTVRNTHSEVHGRL